MKSHTLFQNHLDLRNLTSGFHTPQRENQDQRYGLFSYLTQNLKNPNFLPNTMAIYLSGLRL